MKVAIINLKVNAEEKKAAQALAKELGFSLSSVLKAYLKDFLRNQRVAVSLKEEKRELSDWAKQELIKSEEDVQAGRVVSFDAPADEFEYLDKLIANAKKRNRKG